MRISCVYLSLVKITVLNFSPLMDAEDKEGIVGISWPSHPLLTPHSRFVSFFLLSYSTAETALLTSSDSLQEAKRPSEQERERERKLIHLQICV